MNRRDLTRSVIALPAGFVALHALAVPAAAAPPAASADRDLIALCRRYMSIERRQNILFERERAAEMDGDKELARWLHSSQCHYASYQSDILDEIVDAEPKTAEGLRAKARVCMSRVNRSSDGDPLDADTPLWSLCRDLLGHDPGEGAGA
jgi:hypothetical protein